MNTEPVPPLPEPQIRDSTGTPLEIGMRVGCRYVNEHPAASRRGLTLTGFEPGHAFPYITNDGRWPLAIKDHQPEMDDFISKHVRKP